MNVVCRAHETFCAFLAPPTEYVLRWQRCYIIMTAIIGILTVDIWRASAAFWLVVASS